MTYDRATDKVYNNIYPDRPKTSGMVIPKSLRQTEARPPTQLKTKRYRKKRLTKIEDYKKFKKLRRVKKQREDWEQMEKHVAQNRVKVALKMLTPLRGVRGGGFKFFLNIF